MMMGKTIRVTVYSYTYYVWREMHPSQTDADVDADADVGICEAFCSSVPFKCLQSFMHCLVLQHFA